MNELALFAGAGGGLLASQWLLGWRTVCYVENAIYPIACLKARIREGFLDDAPIWDDVQTFDGKPWRGTVDIVTAGFPCQPWAAGGKGYGKHDDRNLWPDTIRIIDEVRPTWVLLENSPRLLQQSHQRGSPPYVQQIIGQLAVSGYVGQWGCLSAAGIGAAHKRRRLWIVAHTSSARGSELLRGDCGDITTYNEKDRVSGTTATLDAVWSHLSRLEERLGQPSVFGDDDGMAHRVDRLRAIGEGQVPAVVRCAWQLLNPSHSRR